MFKCWLDADEFQIDAGIVVVGKTVVTAVVVGCAVDVVDAEVVCSVEVVDVVVGKIDVDVADDVDDVVDEGVVEVEVVDVVDEVIDV